MAWWRARSGATSRQLPGEQMPGGASASGRRSPVRRRVAFVLWLAALAAIVAGFTVHVPYAILSPGPAVNTLGKDDAGRPLIAVESAKTYPTTGGLDFTTVTVRGGPGYPVTAFDVLTAWVQPHHEILPADEVFPQGASADEVKKANSLQMQGSQENATVVALRALGHQVPEKIVVAGVLTSGPAAGHLQPDDVVTAVDGHAVATSGAARRAIRAHHAGDRVVITVTRGGRSLDVPVVAADHDGTTIVGISLVSSFTIPVPVKISAGDVGGPSAGTMFALGVYDLLTPGALTGGHQIAGTGAIDSDGTVLGIGGIAEKMVAAREAGAEWFLAPAANCGDVVGHVPDGLHVARMASFDDAVKAVTAIGKGTGSTLATCTR